MNIWLALLDTRASFELSTLFVSWVAIVLLALAVAALHLRMIRLEQQLTATPREAFARLMGRPLTELVPQPSPSLVLVLSADSIPSRRLLTALATEGWSWSTLLAFNGVIPGDLPQLPPGVTCQNNGAAFATALETSVIPLAILLDDEGRVRSFLPTSSLDAIRSMIEKSPFKPDSLTPKQEASS